MGAQTDSESDPGRAVRILFVIDSLSFGGAERQCVELLKGLDRSRFEPVLVCLYKAEKGYLEQIQNLGFPIHYLGRRHRLDSVRPLLELRRIIRAERIDLVQTFMNLGSLFGALAARTTGRPVVCSAIRDGRDANWKLKISKRILARISTILISNSRAGLQNRFRKIKPHFRVIYNGLDLRRFETDGNHATEVRADLGVPPAAFVVGMVASLTHYKDQETLIHAIPRVLEAYPGTVFVFVGDGPRRKALERLVADVGVTGQVRFLGFRNDVDVLYPMFQICLLLTDSDNIVEGLPNCLIEAQASGIPVVASRGGGVEEVIDDGRTGLVVEPKSVEAVAAAIRSLIHSDALRSDLSRAARVEARARFALNRYVAEYQNLYREIRSGTGPG